MTKYLGYHFEDTPEFIQTYDELPLWSASFGLLLLKYLPLYPNCTVLDIGSGSGFPLLELAGRLGPSCKLYGIDPWKSANQWALQKIKNYGYTNVEIIEGSAEKIPFKDASIDLIVSNLGINNFDNPEVVLKECHRVLKVGGRLVLTTNLNGHWKEFYTIFKETLVQLGVEQFVVQLEDQENHRGTVESITQLFAISGYGDYRHFEERFEMKFLNGTAFLNHHFVKLGWLNSWTALIPKELHLEVFHKLEENLNIFSLKSNGLCLMVPMAYMEGVKFSQ